MTLMVYSNCSSSSSSSSSFPDIWTWIQTLPPITQWTNNSKSISIHNSLSHPSLRLSLSQNPKSSYIFFSFFADYNLPISLWTSKPIKITSKSTPLLDHAETISKIFTTFIEHVLQYCPNKNISFLKVLPKQLNFFSNLKEIFNFTCLTLSFIICVYEAPTDIRSECLVELKNHLACAQSREVSKTLMRLLGSNIEEQWMRAVNLAITNWIMEEKVANRRIKTPSPLFTYANSAYGMWKVQLYCPLTAMDMEKSSSPSSDEKLEFSLNYHQAEGVIQLNYKVMVQETWIDVIVNVDNIRCDVVKLVNDTLMRERGAGKAEKHFPSRISLRLTPIQQMNVISISVSKSSENPNRDISHEKTIQGSLNPPDPYIGITVSAGETVTMSLKPWKFEQSVYGNTGNLNWFLHDSVNGREVFSSKPSWFSLLKPRAWFKNRYSNVYRPFTRQGGVIFADDEYGESVCWKVDKGAIGRVMEWEISGCIWVTYWPNKHRTFYTETRRLEFKEIVQLVLN